MAKKIKKPEVGANINVEIFEPKKGKFPIGRYEGIICKLQLGENMKYVPYGSICDCVVLEIKPKFFVVKVIEVIVSAEANKLNIEAKMKELKGLSKVQKPHQKKTRNYPFLSNTERG
jgi:hypothetical protein